MKKLIILFIGLVFSASVFSQNLDSFFDKLEDSEDYAVITVNKEMFKMIAAMGIDVEGQDVEELIDGINRLQIFVQEENADIEIFKEARSLLRNSDMSELLSVNKGSEKVYLYTDQSDGAEIVKNLVLLVHEDSQNVFIRLDGKINLKALSKLTKDIHIDGFEHLNKIGEHRK